MFKAPDDSARRSEAAEIIRGLIEKIVLSPVGRGKERTLVIDLHGHLAAILALGSEVKKKAAGNSGNQCLCSLEQTEIEKQIKMVAGAGFEPTTFRL